MRVAWLLVLALMAAPFAQAQAPDGRGGLGTPVLTLYMKVIGSLEQQLAEADARGDAAALDRLLGPFFELRRPRQEAMAREGLMAASRARAGKTAAASIGDLSVYEVGTEAVAYFLLREADGHTRSVVDIWTRTAAGSWQLRLRFEQPL